MNHQRFSLTSLVIIVLIAAGCFWAGLAYHHYQVDQLASSAFLLPSSPTATTTTNANTLPSTITSNRLSPSNNPAVNQQQLAALMQQLAVLQQQMKGLQQQRGQVPIETATNTNPVAESAALITDPATLLSQRRQERQELEQATHNRIQHLDQAVYAGQMDSARQTQLQQQVQDALQTANLTEDVNLTAANCSTRVCKLQLQGKSKNGKNVLFTLYENRVFPGGTRLLTVPDDKGNLTIYASVGNALLP